MNILELDSFNLADTVKFHDRLNPRLWDDREHLRPEVHAKLMEIARDFQEFLGVPDLDIKDITVSGSNAAYNYTPTSDIDLHLVIDLPEADHNEVYRELFDAKKFQYNAQHNIRIGGYDVELYVQNPHQEHHSQGIYSLLRNTWLAVPRRRKAEIDDISTKSKYEDLAERINHTVATGDHDKMASLMKKIKNLRQSGLEHNGEFGADNLAFKMLRNNGYIKKLVDARNAARDAELSLAEKARPKQKITYGFVNESPDGVNPSTKMFLEEPDSNDEVTVRDFIDFVAERLGITQMPEIVLHTDPNWSQEHKSFGRYTPETHTLEVNLANRHIMDILRTTAHELVHCRQNQEHQLPSKAGATGSKWENQAHAVAGVIMRDYADQNPAMFENASGYIPRNKKEAAMPQYAMALSVDIKPGQVGKEANKLALRTGKNGEPALLMKTANLLESTLAAEFEAFAEQGMAEGKSYGYNSAPLSQVPGEREDELGNQEATGPEFPPEMPAGTTKIDVKDLTDWYKLGMDISDMDDADPADYGKGPPQTVIVFPSDEAEQGYLKQFKRLGLKTHDMDPDVEGGEDVAGKHLRDLDEAFEQLEEQFLGEVKMTSGNLAKLAKDIKGVKVGLEFEMIVPNAEVSGDEDVEPDMDMDERVRDIDDAVNFFDDGDYNSRNELRRLREAMESDFFDWQIEKIDELWNSNDGWEFFTNYLDREEPFDEDDAREEATNELQAQYGDDITPEEFEKMLTEIVGEKAANYYQEQWDEQGYNYDHAREEFEEEQRDALTEEDWLDSQGIRYASDVESNYGHVTWPYYTNISGDDESDIERVALDFMNGIGADTVAYSSSYHGSYKKWVGNGWVLVGSEKPDDCFSIEPDGSLEGDSSSDVGLEFVSPPIPLEDIGSVMAKVQNWASNYGAYTGKRNKTSIHTNISVPGYDLDKLDYLKAALLLGDEYVLREFDRIGNTYAAPAIEKVKQLVQQKPEKAQELLDKMKSQLNAEASKLIHSGQTNKFTSINTKGNRVEFRSPGGDYLDIIADNPQKMMDTINRMVVTLDAAMDPDKYKQEYQKKLYKVLTGQGGGREAKSGAKQAMKASDKDLINIFTRYAAGELPRAALKSFVRQAQLERRGKKAEADLTSHNWAIFRRGSRDIVRTFQADDYMAAHEVYKQYKQKHNITDDSLIYGPYNPAEEKPEQQPQSSTAGSREYEIFADTDPFTVVRSFYAADDQAAQAILDRYRQEHPGTYYRAHRAPVPGSTLDLQRRRAAAAQQSQPAGEPSSYELYRISDGRTVTAPAGNPIVFLATSPEDAESKIERYVSDFGLGSVSSYAVRSVINAPAQQSTSQGNWGIWMLGADRFANQPGEYPRGAEVPLYRFPSRQAAEQWIEQQRSQRPRMRTDIEVREIEPREPLPDLFPELPGTPAAQQGSVVNYELYNRLTDEVIDTFPARNDREAMTRLNDYREHGAGQSSPDHFGVRRGPGVDNTAQTNHNGPWEIFRMEDGRVMGTIPAGFSHRQAEAELYRRADTAGYDPEILDVRPARQTPDQEQGGLVDVAGEQPATAPRTLTTPGQPQQQFTGEWDVVMGDEVVFRVRGENQSIANQAARQWILGRSSEFLRDHQGQEVEVVPRYAE